MRVACGGRLAVPAMDAGDDECLVCTFDADVLALDAGHGDFDDEVVTIWKRVQRRRECERRDALRHGGYRSRQGLEFCERASHFVERRRSIRSGFLLLLLHVASCDYAINRTR